MAWDPFLINSLYFIWSCTSLLTNLYLQLPTTNHIFFPRLSQSINSITPIGAARHARCLLELSDTGMQLRDNSTALDPLIHWSLNISSLIPQHFFIDSCSMNLHSPVVYRALHLKCEIFVLFNWTSSLNLSLLDFACNLGEKWVEKH